MATPTKDTLSNILTDVFPCVQVNDDEFLYLNSSLDLNYKLNKLYNACSEYLTHSNTLSTIIVNMKCTLILKTTFTTINTNTKLNTKVIQEDGVSFIHFNERSLRTNFMKIYEYLKEPKFSFDALTISETWADTATITEFYRRGYDSYHTVRGTRGGDVGIYTRKHLLSKSIKNI